MYWKLGFYLLIAMILSMSCQNGVRLVAIGKAKSTIVVDKSNASMLNNAEILRDYVERISGVRIAIADMEETYTGLPLFIELDAELDDQAIEISTDKKEGVCIAAGSSKALKNAVYLFIEDVLDVRWYSPTAEEIPSASTIRLPEMDYSYSPEIATRTVHSRLFYENEEFADKMKVTTRAFPYYAEEARVHTFHRFMPEQTFYKSHPEYYALRADGRLPTQLCLTNPDVLAIVIDSVEAVFERNPDADIVSVSQDDNQQYCQCESCQNIDEEEGSHAGTMIRFVNQVAEKFADKQISTLAYQHTRKPPKTKPRENVLITLCSIECDRSGPISEKCQEFAEELEGWGQLTDNIRIWDYTTQFTNFLAPFPNLHTLQPNIKLFRDNNANWVFEQHSRHPSELFELRSYVTAKLLWNPDVDFDELIMEFTDGYYKEAAPYIRQYIDDIHQAIDEEDDFFLFLYGDPSQAFSSFLNAENLSKYCSYFDEAEEAVGGNPELLKRVRAARLSVDYAMLEACRKHLSDSLSLLTDKGANKSINPIVERFLHRFEQTTRENSISLLNETGFTVDEYIDAYSNALSTALLPNRAKGKIVQTLTAPKKYADEDPMVLTDGALGGSSFYSNWLGYEGVPMEVVVDLGQEEEISSVKMNFLQVTNHVVFLPRSVSYYGSTDGEDYYQLGRVKCPAPLSKSSKVNDIQDYSINFDKKPVRYLKVKAENTPTPYWHHAAGLPSWIFADEIIVD